MSDLDIKKIRKNLFLTQEEFAKLLGVTRNTVLNYERGKPIPESKSTILSKLLIKSTDNDKPIDNKIPNFHMTESERKKALFNSFGDIASGDEKLQTIVEKLTRFNDILTKENILQSKIIEGLEFKINILEKQLSELK